MTAHRDITASKSPTCRCRRRPDFIIGRQNPGFSQAKLRKRLMRQRRDAGNAVRPRAEEGGANQYRGACHPAWQVGGELPPCVMSMVDSAFGLIRWSHSHEHPNHAGGRQQTHAYYSAWRQRASQASALRPREIAEAGLRRLKEGLRICGTGSWENRKSEIGGKLKKGVPRN